MGRGCTTLLWAFTTIALFQLKLWVVSCPDRPSGSNESCMCLRMATSISLCGEGEPLIAVTSIGVEASFGRGRQFPLIGSRRGAMTLAETKVVLLEWSPWLQWKVRWRGTLKA